MKIARIEVTNTAIEASITFLILFAWSLMTYNPSWIIDVIGFCICIVLLLRYKLYSNSLLISSLLAATILPILSILNAERFGSSLASKIFLFLVLYVLNDILSQNRKRIDFKEKKVIEY